MDLPERHCQQCGALLVRKRFLPSGQIEDLKRFMTRKHCDKKCMGQAMMKDKPTRSAMLKRAAKYLKDRCEQCGAKEHRTIHHKDRNWRNNAPSNLQTLCSSCHTSLHHAAGEISPKKPKTPCYVCGKPSCSLGLCDTCYSRKRRYGDPYLKKIKSGASWQLVSVHSLACGPAFSPSSPAVATDLDKSGPG